MTKHISLMCICWFLT